MNKTIEEMWTTAILVAGKENQFETTWADVRDKFAKLLIERCASIVCFSAPDDDIADYLKYEVLKLGAPDES